MMLFLLVLVLARCFGFFVGAGLPVRIAAGRRCRRVFGLRDLGRRWFVINVTVIVFLVVVGIEDFSSPFFRWRRRRRSR